MSVLNNMLAFFLWFLLFKMNDYLHKVKFNCSVLINNVFKLFYFKSLTEYILMRIYLPLNEGNLR